MCILTNILLVNDNPHELTKLELQLVSLSADLNLHAYTDPMEAMLLLRENTYDMLYVNYRMAVLDGLSLVRVANKLNDNMYVTIMASQADATFIKTQTTFQACDHLILLPCEIHDLHQSLQQYQLINKVNEENKLFAARVAMLHQDSQTAQQANTY